MPTPEQLEALLEKEPNDPFLNFGLAMAFVKAGRTAEALERFDRTLAADRDYLAAYFHKARLLAALDRSEEARGTLREGIERAAATGDEHAREEMGGFLASLG